MTLRTHYQDVSVSRKIFHLLQSANIARLKSKTVERARQFLAWLRGKINTSALTKHLGTKLKAISWCAVCKIGQSRY